MEDMGCVYMIYNNENLYIGSTNNFHRRRTGHKSSCQNNKSRGYNDKIYEIMRANGGFDAFTMEIIEKYKLREDWEQAEISYIKNFKPNMNGITYKTKGTKIQCECGEMITKKNMGKHKKTATHKKLLLLSIEQREELKRPKTRTEKNITLICECGRFVQKEYIKKHKQSQIHKLLMRIASI